MKKKVSTFLTCIPLALYFTLLFYKYGIFFSFGQGILIYSYFFALIAGVFFSVRKSLWVQNREKSFVYIVSFLLSAMSVCFLGDFLLLRFSQSENKIEITATGKKNEDAYSAEVWITKIEVDGATISLQEIEPAKGWYYLEDKKALVSYPNGEGALQIIGLKKAEQIRISFVKHPWSGIVKINMGGKITEADLYDPNSSGYVYEVTGGLFQKLWLDLLSVLAAWVILFFLYLGLCCLCTRRKRGIVFLSLLYTSVLFVSLRGVAEISPLVLLLVLLSHVCSSAVGMEWYFKQKKSAQIMLSTITIPLCFMVFGARIFLLPQNYSLLQIGKFVGMALWMIPYVAFLCRCFERTEAVLHGNKTQTAKKNGRRGKVLMAAFSIVLGICFTRSIQEVFFFRDNGSCTFTITPTGEKNRESQGTEVLLSGILVNGASYRPDAFDHFPDGWKNVNGMIFGVGTTPLEIDIPSAGTVAVVFNKHEWSGKVKIEDGENTEVIDLYNPPGSPSYIETYHVTNNKIPKDSWADIIALGGIFVLCTGAFLLVLELLRKVWIEGGGRKSFFAGVFLAELLIYMFYILASYPASICYDGRTQLYQALGYEPLTDAHPVLHTLLIKYLTFGGKLLVAVPIMQAITLSALSAVILQHLFKKGINRKILMLFGVCSALAVNNGIYITTLWKDVPYSICLLWLSYLFCQMGSDKEYIMKRGRIALVAVALGAARLLRHNGIVVLIGCCIVMVCWSIARKNLRYVLGIFLAALIVIAVREPFYQAIGVERKEAVSSSSILHGLVYAGIQGDIPSQTAGLLTDIMPMEEWEKCYSKYSANELLMSWTSEQYQVSEKIAAKGTAQMIKEYCRTLLHSPIRLIEDRLFGIDILWNVFQDAGYDWRVANNTYEIGIISNNMGWYRHDNSFTGLVKAFYRLASGNKLADSFFWRAGLWLGLLLVLFCYGHMKEKGVWSCYCPVLFNIISLCLAMAWQDFRYVYFVNLCMPYLALMCLSKEGPNVKNKNDNFIAIGEKDV